MVNRFCLVLAILLPALAISVHWSKQSAAAPTEKSQSTNLETLRDDKRWGPVDHLLRGCLVVERDTSRERGDYELIVELQNRCGHPVEFDFNPKDLKVELFDAAGKTVPEPSAKIRSGPMPQPHQGIISPASYVGVPTHRGGIALSPNAIVFAAGWQHWELTPGIYTLKGSLTVAIKHGEKWPEPSLPSRESPYWLKKQDVLPLGEQKRVQLELGQTTFQIVKPDEQTAH